MRKYRPRHRNNLTAAEQQQIVDSYVKEYIPQKEVARRFRITPQLVSNLVTDSKKRPEKLREVKAREKLRATQREAIQSAVGGLRQGEQVISSSKMVQSVVKEQTDAELSLKQIRLALRKDCRLGFVRAKKFQPRANSDRCLVQR